MLSGESRILRDTILALPNVATAFLWKGVVKVFFGEVTPDVPLPYIVIRPVVATWDNPDRNLSDSIWEVAVHTDSVEVAQQWADVLSRLHNNPPVINVADICQAGDIQIETNVWRRSVQQNHTYFVAGWWVCLPLKHKGF